MNVNDINNFGLLALMIIELFLMFKCLRYWLQIKTVLKDENEQPSMYSQGELNNTAIDGDFKQGYGMIFSNIAISAKILFSPKLDNPKLLSSVKGIRRSIFLFFLAPLIVAFILIFITALLQ